MVSPTQGPGAIYQNGVPPAKADIRTWMTEMVNQLTTETATGNVIELQNIGGSANAITADIYAPLVNAGISIVNLSKVILSPNAANTGPVTLSIAGDTVREVRRSRGESLEAGDLAANEPVLLRRYLETWRIVAGGVSRSQVAASIADEATARQAADDLLKPTVSALSMGDVYGRHEVNTQSLNGASTVTGAGGVARGVTIPDGQTGAGTYITPVVDVTDYQGETVFFRTRFRASPNLLARIERGPTRAQKSSGGGFTTLTLTGETATQKGEILELSGVATIDAGVTKAGLCLQVAAASTATVGLREAIIESVEIGVISTAGDEIAVKRRFEISARDLLGYDENPTVGAAQALNGATRLNDEFGAGIGISVPVGQTGASSYVIRFFSADGLRAGDWIRVTSTYDVTANFMSRQPLGPVTFTVRASRNGANINRNASRRLSQTGMVLTVVTDYQVQGDEYMLGPCLQLASGGDTAFPRSFKATSMQMVVLGQAESDADATLRYVLARQQRDIVEQVSQPPVGMDIAITTAGPTFANAILQSAAASAMTPVIWEVATGDYTTEFNWVLPKYVEMRGGSERPHIHYELPDGSALNPASYQPFFVRDTGKLTGLDISVRNGRYATHIEANGTNPDATIELTDCKFEHLGNSIGAWASQAALGMGVSSGWHVTSQDCTYVSPVFPFSWHSNVDFDAPALVENRRDTFVALTDSTGSGIDGSAIRIQPMGSGQRDRHVIEDCVISGDILYSLSTWMPSTLDNQPANHAEVQVSGKGNSPAVFRIADFGRALKIAAPDDTAASVVVSGAAVAVLLGQVEGFPGVSGLPAYVHGTVDVSGEGVGPGSNVFITSLGQRLGNRTGAAISMTVTVDGVSRTVTFGSNHSAASNADILTLINTALDGIAVASLYAVGERYRPNFSDEEMTLINGQSYGIPMGSLLAYDGSPKRARLMTSADDPSLFAGIAWEDIYPGKVGRVKTRGYLPLSDIRRGGGVSITFGTALSVSASTPGVAVAGGSQGLLRGISDVAVALRGT